MSDRSERVVPGSSQPTHDYEMRISRLLHEFNIIRDLFDFKDILDIGCAEGRITCGIADRFPINTIRGIDLDEDNIERAIRNIVRPGDRQIYFCQEDYAPKTEAELNAEFETLKPEYDTILCLSVTKSIHLKGGDDGLKLCFRRMYKQLKFGGTLIFEPNSIRSYLNTRPPPGKKIEFFPSDFPRYLESIGFQFKAFHRLHYRPLITLYTKPPMETPPPKRIIKKTTPKKRRKTPRTPSPRKTPRKPLRI